MIATIDGCGFPAIAPQTKARLERLIGKTRTRRVAKQRAVDRLAFIGIYAENSRKTA